MRLGGLNEFKRDVQLGEYILIVGSGPSAQHVSASHNPRWSEITRGFSVMLVNGAPDIADADVYVAFDKNCPKYDWYHGGRAKHYLIGVELAKLKPPDCDYYTFEYQPTLHKLMAHDFCKDNANSAAQKWEKLHNPQVLHGGGTIVCCAYQLAMSYQPQVINMIGVEMTGGIWWNKQDEQPKSRERHGVQPLNMLVSYAADYMGIRSYHIGATRLSCKEIKPEAFYDTAA
jgi:hypothetical protein